MATLASHPSAFHSPIPNRIAVLLAAALFMLACPLHAGQVELRISVEGELQPTIKGSCNLPDGMKILVRVTRKESAYQSEILVEVQAGHFQVGPLLQRTANLNPGVYSVEIVSAAEQPDSVRAAIGHKGEELHGPLSKRDAVGTRVRFLGTFALGQAANAELDQARREQVKLSETRWWRKNCTEICSGGQRYAEQKGQPFDRPACFKTCVSNPPSITR